MGKLLFFVPTTASLLGSVYKRENSRSTKSENTTDKRYYIMPRTMVSGGRRLFFFAPSVSNIIKLDKLEKMYIALSTPLFCFELSRGLGSTWGKFDR